MGIGELLMISVEVSMDAFTRLSVERVEKRHLLSAGLWFGSA